MRVYAQRVTCLCSPGLITLATNSTPAPLYWSCRLRIIVVIGRETQRFGPGGVTWTCQLSGNLSGAQENPFLFLFSVPTLLEKKKKLDSLQFTAVSRPRRTPVLQQPAFAQRSVITGVSLCAKTALRLSETSIAQAQTRRLERKFSQPSRSVSGARCTITGILINVAVAVKGRRQTMKCVVHKRGYDSRDRKWGTLCFSNRKNVGTRKNRKRTEIKRR